ncbi:IS256 family transposase, partial [Yersinia pestis]
HLALDIEANRKNGSSRKTVKTPTGTFELATPRDRNGTFEPQLVMGPTISSGTPVVAEKMGQFVVLLPVSDNDPQGHLHDKCH